MFKRYSKRSPRVTSLACWCFALLISASASALDRLPPIENTVQDTAKAKDNNPLRLLTKDDFSKAGPFNLGGGPKRSKVSARFTKPSGDTPGMLYITAEMDKGWYTYAITQGPKGGKPAAITVDRSREALYRLKPGSEFKAEPAAKRGYDDAFKAEAQKHYGKVTWSIPLEFDAAAKLDTLRVTGNVELQVCNKVCINEKHTFSAELDDVQFVAAPPDPLGRFNQVNAGAGGKRVRLSASFTAPAGKKPGMLTITADIAKGFHIYATTQGKGAGKPTKIDVAKSNKFRLLGDFTAGPKADKKQDDVFKVEVQTHHGRVKWTAPFELLGGAKADGLTISGKVAMQACDEGSCLDVALNFAARPAGGAKAPAGESVQIGTYKDKGVHAVIHGYIQPGSAQPGETVRLVLTAVPSPKWHIYAMADRVPADVISMPTLIVIEDAAGLEVGRTTTESEPQRHEFKIKGDDRQYVHNYHQQQVTWTTDIKIPTGAKPGDYIIRGIMGFQTCFKEACDQPQAASFTARLPVGDASKENLPLSFTKAKFGDAKALAEARLQSTELDFDKIRAANQPAEQSFVVAIALAFLAGLILNVMPCVLPVIGLKVMSFVQQAGESRSRVLALNLWYSAGLMSVFMTLATLAVVANLGWGDQFSSTWFSVTMTAVVFVFGLSLLGVWEVPIPGFVGSGKTAALAEREGAGGAFSKGVLTTILATPCIGPFLGPSLTWAMQQPAHVTYAAFFSVGMGMASPYLLIGAFPKLVAFLPKPGAWMETFKQSMGFVLMATVVFLLTVVPPAYVIPTIGLLIGLSITCWWVGRTPMTADRSKRLTAWVGGAMIAAALGVVSFVYLHDYTAGQLDDLFQIRAQNQGSTTAVSDADEDDLPWRPFSKPLLKQLVAEGNTVLIDFTGPM